jgi:siroheme synthase, N-terminal domain
MWFPLFVNLKNKKVLVIGGGKVAFKKIIKIMEYEADITVIAENIAEEKLLELKNLKIENNRKIENNKDEIEKLVKEYFFVIATTDNEELNENIAEICDSKGILINNASSKTKMNVMFGGIVKNDEFQIAISTSGKNCRRSRAMKSEIQKILDRIEK